MNGNFHYFFNKTYEVGTISPGKVLFSNKEDFFLFLILRSRQLLGMSSLNLSEKMSKTISSLLL